MLGLSLLPMFAASANATIITYAGSLIDIGASWRTASASKGAFSSSGVLGGNGYYIVGAQGVISTPGYVSSFLANPAIYGGNGSYAMIDNPGTTPGTSPSQLRSGTFNEAVGTDNPGTPLSFTLGGSVPGIFQVGLLIDNTDAAIWNNHAIELSSSISGAGPEIATVDSSYNNGVPDIVFFDVADATAGETISILAFAGAGMHVELGAAMFDTTASAVPEPASLTLLGVGLASTGLAARRRRPAAAPAAG